MRIAIVSTSSVGGAGIAARRYSEAMNSIGLENDFFALTKNSQNQVDAVRPLGRTRIETLRSKGLTVLQRELIQKDHNLITPLSLEPNSVQKILKNYDLIHLHSSYNILNKNGLVNLIDSGKQIVITLHDQRWFTGGCHYSGECKNYVKDCSNCPQATRLGQVIVAKSFRDRAGVFGKSTNLKVISPSRWLENLASKSLWLTRANLTVIRNPIPTFDTTLLNLNLSKIDRNEPTVKRIFFVSDNLQNPLKGLDVLIAALKHLRGIGVIGFHLYLVGNNAPNVANFPVETTILNARSTFQLCNYLHDADVLVVPSLQDNLPNVIGEAFSVGVKVIGSTAGGIPEIITPKTGFTFENGDSKALAHILMEFTPRYSRSEILSYFSENFEYSTVAKKIKDFYQV
jgi:glycosyltransferase involved in cell wall biosynthesis